MTELDEDDGTICQICKCWIPGIEDTDKPNLCIDCQEWFDARERRERRAEERRYIHGEIQALQSILGHFRP